jgi:hypothetical protein
VRDSKPAFTQGDYEHKSVVKKFLQRRIPEGLLLPHTVSVSGFGAARETHRSHVVDCRCEWLTRMAGAAPVARDGAGTRVVEKQRRAARRVARRLAKPERTRPSSSATPEPLLSDARAGSSVIRIRGDAERVPRRW